MTGYKRQISYLDHLADGEKAGNAGFVKAEENDGRMRLEVRVKNLPDTISGEFLLCEEGGRQLGRISISRGAGSCCLVWEETAEKEKEMWIESGGLFIRLPGGRLLKAVWKEPVRVAVQKTEAGQDAFQETGQQGEAFQEAEEQGKAGTVEYPELKWRDAEALFEPEMRINSADFEPPAPQEQICEPEGGIPQKQIREPESGASQATYPAPQAESACRCDKWEQLCTMYPVIHPFEDGREYLSVAPKDFVVLRQEYQKMVHSAAPGDFGYFMKRVEI